MYYIFYEEKYIAIHFCGGPRHTSQLRSFFSFEQKHNSQSLMALVVKLAAFLRYQKYWPLIGNWAKKSLFNQLHNGWLEDLKMSWLSEKPISSQPGSYKT